MTFGVYESTRKKFNLLVVAFRNTQTYVFDITDLDNPVVTQRYASTQTSIDHNQYIVGSYVGALAYVVFLSL